jgi:Nucleotidyltransferase of unknown function (DUF6036)
LREVADADRIRRFAHELGVAADVEAVAYLTGGATAVLLGWRTTTIDVDVVFVPESDALLRALPRLKEQLRLNVELASPADFVPLPEGWEERSLFVAREGRLTFRHFDPYSQALSKLERGHGRDLGDVRAMIERGLVDAARLLDTFDEIEPRLYGFPAIDPPAFRRRVEKVAVPQPPRR